MKDEQIGMDERWTPLWSTIITSTLWGESKDVKILFVTMMAMKDCYGKVTSTTSGLSRAAVLTFEETAAALEVLERPDEKSDTHQEFDGRRIKRVEGGWVILNSEKYKGMVQTLKRRNYQRNWQAEQREIKAAIEDGKPMAIENLSAAGKARYFRALAKGRKAVEKSIEHAGEVAGRTEGVRVALHEAHREDKPNNGKGL